MEKKIKFIIIGFIIILGISLLINLQIYSSKIMVVKERDDLKKENTSLNSKIDELKDSLRNNEDKISSLNKELDSAMQEKEGLQKNFELLTKERQELIERLKTQEKTVRVVEKEPPAVIGDAYWAGILKAKTDLELQLDNLRGELKTAKLNNEQLQTERGGLDLEVKNLEREREDLKRQLDYNQKLMDSLAQELVREKNDKLQISNTLKPIKNENEVLRQQLKSLNNRKLNLERKIGDLQKENDGFTARLSEMETLLQEKILQIANWQSRVGSIGQTRQLKPEENKEAKEFVELSPIVVRPQPQAEAPGEKTDTSLQGAILAVNRDNNFVIIDLGEDKGIKMGDTFKVYRQENAIANVEVIQVRKTIAACDIKKETAPIKVGDIVK